MTNQELIKKAIEAMSNSYSPYSEFKVGASILLKDGTVVFGTNIENASYGATICAERSAIVGLLSNGHDPKDILKIAIVSDLDKPTGPCCLCRQVMLEFFSNDVEVILSNTKYDELVLSISDLVPYPFGSDDLGIKNV